MSADEAAERGPQMSKAAETAYREIRRAIITGAMGAGEKLQESKLAERIGVSRTPVREALQRLDGEGLVVLEKYRQGRVAAFTERDVAEVFRLRALLEGEAAGRAASRISAADIERLEQLERQMEALFDELGWHQHLEAFDALNNEFHMIIAHAADSPRLVRILASSVELPASIFASYREPVDDRTRRTHWQHREIIAALRMGNARWAEAQMSAHLLSLLATGD